MKIAVCDDDPMWIIHMEEYISRLRDDYSETEYDTYTSGDSLLEYYKTHGNQYNIVILDIEMNGVSGIETAQKIRDMDSEVCIFFLTSHREYVYDCFRPSPMNFWVKPVEYDVFRADIARAYKRIEESDAYLKVIENRSRIRIKCADIIYIENKDRKSHIYTASQVYTVGAPLGELMRELDNSVFVRVYKSFIINLKYVHIIEESGIRLYGSDRVIPLSRTYKKELENKYINFTERENF